MKRLYTLALLLLTAFSALSQNSSFHNQNSNTINLQQPAKNETSNENMNEIYYRDTLKMAHKSIDLNNSVYNLLDFYESTGILGFLPTEKPYSRSMIVGYLSFLNKSDKISKREKKVINRYLSYISRPTNGFVIHRSDRNKTTDNSPKKTNTLNTNDSPNTINSGNSDKPHIFTVMGSAATLQIRAATGDNGTFHTTNIIEPFFGGDLGKNITFFGSIGLSVDKLTPDMFYNSYVKGGKVNFPHENTGYAFHPYMFDYETMWNHVKADASTGGGSPIQDDLTAGTIYRAELSGSFLRDAIRFSIHNNRRSWGHSYDNLNLSARARRFPGIDLVFAPNDWISYSMVIGSLFDYGNQREDYKKNIYGYDIGEPQKMITLQKLRVAPAKWAEFTFTGGNIWSKRFEPIYMIPFTFPLLTQIDVGDHDNLTMGFDAAFMIPNAGKLWFSVFIDEFSFIEREESLLKMPRNRYAWQIGWNTPLLQSIMPLTMLHASYTRVTPFAYTHYPETEFNLFSDRPLDLTYTHDGANLGFYLPPNSAEAKLKITTLALKNLKVEIDNRFIIHGTNDLDGDTYQIFGDIYRHQDGDAHQYPLLDFTKDGIYDYTWYTELRADNLVRQNAWISKQTGVCYGRLFGTLGFSKTWWKSNQSGVTAPEDRTLISFSIGIAVDF